jgi:hypothetical protein
MAHTALPVAVILLHIRAVADKGAMNTLRTCFRWRSELLKPRTLFFPAGKGAMNAPHCWKSRKLYLTGVALGAKVFVTPFQIVNDFLSLSKYRIE